ncbi:MAG: type II toxin-antitoxin system prevent-host-death family antitoxin [Candidatus Paceibacterota bacterium]
MDLKELKKVIEGEASKVIIVENGEPVFVVMSFEEYKKTKGQQSNLSNDSKNLPNSAKELMEEQLKIEDLPF